MFDKLGVIYVDHLAVTTNDFEETVKHYLSLPNARVLRGPGWNNSQNVKFLFVNFGSDLCVEILGLPETQGSPIKAHVKAGGGAYHLCYAVSNLDKALENAKKLGARILVEAKEDDAFDGRRVAFLLHPSHGMFELVEAYGSVKTNKLKNIKISREPEKKANRIEEPNNEILATLTLAFENIFSQSLPASKDNWNSEEIENWDSLQHLRLIMEIERSLDIKLPSHILSEIDSFSKFYDALNTVSKPIL